MTLITGGAGFVASHLINKMPSDKVVALVRLGKVGSYERIKDRFNVKMIFHDFRSPFSDRLIDEIGPINNIIHMGAETHVDRSIGFPVEFVESNVLGTMNVLEYARKIKLDGRFIQFSTDEVFGPAPGGHFYYENDYQMAKNPYAGAKAGAEQLAWAWANTYGLNVSVIRSMNIFGKYQDSEKFIPLCIRKILNGEVISIHSNKDKTKSGTRFYIHADDVADAVKLVLERGKNDTSYHCVGEKEVSNLDLALTIGKILGKVVKYEMVDFHSSRPGHDLRYALGNIKLADLGWKLSKTFEDSLIETVEWYLANPVWHKEHK